LQVDLSVHQTATKPSTCSFAAVPPSCGSEGATIGLEVGVEIGVLIGDDELTDNRGATCTGLVSKIYAGFDKGKEGAISEQG
jgi:hypothetical protein